MATHSWRGVAGRIHRWGFRQVLRRCGHRFLSAASHRRPSWSLDPLTGTLTASDSQAARYQAILGVEIHVQLDIPTKLFSTAPTVSAGAPNTAVHPYDAAVPGVLPCLAVQAVQAAVVAARLLQCDDIATTSRFERKHYAYADLPHAYQITQQRWPLARHGKVETTYAATASKAKKSKKKKQPEQYTLSCRINRLQLEQDSGKTVQVRNANTGFRESRVDLNRAGQALVEIVSEPDLRTPQEAAAMVEHVRQLFKHVHICNGRMEEGSLRCDLNVNLQDLSLPDETQRSARVEVKNLNSLRQIIDAATYELLRHAAEWPTVEETRTWNVVAQQTELIRRKDQAQDYRFMPEPDLPPLVLNSAVFDGLSMEEFLQQRIPELPAQAVERFIEQYALTEYQAGVIAGDPPAIPFLDQAIATAHGQLIDASERQVQRAIDMTTNFLINDLFGLVKEHTPDDQGEPSVAESHVTAEQLGEIMAMILNSTISTTMAKNLLQLLYTTERGGQPAQVAASQGWQLVTDEQALRALCEQVLKEHPNEIDTFRKGGKYEIKIYKFFTGKAMAASRGTAEPERLKDILQQVLDENK